MGTIAPAYVPSPKREQRHRRTVYTVQMRNLANPLQEVFNAADMNSSCERRDATTVAPQVFALFNSEFTHDMALHMARHLESLASDRPGQVDRAFLLAFGRPPDDRERSLCLAHVESMLEHHRRTEPRTEEKAPGQVVRNHIGELSGKRFEFVEDWDLKDVEPNIKPSDVSPETRALAELCLVILNANEFIYLP